MDGTYKIRGAFRQAEWSPTPDELFWLLDSLGLDRPPWIVIESREDDGRFLQALSVGDRKIDVEFRESSQEELTVFPAIDVIVAHQMILKCLSEPRRWKANATRIATHMKDLTYGHPDGVTIDGDLSYDYSQSGLSVQVALIDYVKRAEVAGIDAGRPPLVRWGSLLVTGGDVWAVSGPGSASVVLERSTPNQRHGISISSARAGLATDEDFERPEVIIWPNDKSPETTIRFNSSIESLRISNVFMSSDRGLSRIGRWLDNSALSVEVVSSHERVYRCNYYATSPAAFDDLIFRVILAR